MRKPRILAVDDDALVLDYLQEKLADRYDLIKLTDPTQAVSVATRENPDLIMCDIDMPDMHGGEVCADLAENAATASIPFMYLTAIVSPAEAKRLAGIVGGSPGVAKRAPTEVLIEAIESLRRKG